MEILSPAGFAAQTARATGMAADTSRLGFDAEAAFDAAVREARTPKRKSKPDTSEVPSFVPEMTAHTRDGMLTIQEGRDVTPNSERKFDLRKISSREANELVREMTSRGVVPSDKILHLVPLIPPGQYLDLTKPFPHAAIDQDARFDILEHHADMFDYANRYRHGSVSELQVRRDNVDLWRRIEDVLRGEGRLA
jgi:hypothetical protein